eukprot:TRINITY_DN10328_c0_g1_i1.p1 TRINITY_DN10328_c0_g1~~TRINITY_DN10328_c0_g1_i1.p1  ORF type:complete len:434 (+),score=86.11 TRINITY_DN10328_c0_g1_i1:134-1435(+)
MSPPVTRGGNALKDNSGKRPQIATKLPKDMWLHILPFCDIVSFVVTGRVNRSFQRLAASEELWRQRCATLAIQLSQPTNYSWKSLYRYLHQQPEVLLPFRVLQCDGGHYSVFYEARHLHDNNGRVFCSRKPHDVNVLSVPDLEGVAEVVVTCIICKTPAGGFTSPLQDFGCVFLTTTNTTTTTPTPATTAAGEESTGPGLEAGPGEDESAFISLATQAQRADPQLAQLRRMAATLPPGTTSEAEASILLGGSGGGYGHDDPPSPLLQRLPLVQSSNAVVCHFPPQETLFVATLTKPVAAKLIFTRLFEGAKPDDNIDVQYLGFAGRVIPLHLPSPSPSITTFPTPQERGGGEVGGDGMLIPFSWLSRHSFRHPIHYEWGVDYLHQEGNTDDDDDDEDDDEEDDDEEEVGGGTGAGDDDEEELTYPPLAEGVGN